MLVMGEAMHVWGQGYMGNLRTLPNFTEPKTCLKKKKVLK